jgi:phage/plasmid-like protein (TIGR03299 family)
MEKRGVPWHTGRPRVIAQSAAELIRAFGLDWKVVKTESFEGQAQVPGRSFVVREELWSQHKGGLLGTVRSGYEPMQNTEAFSLFDPIVHSGKASYDSAGCLNDGQWVWVVLRFSGDLEVGPGDVIVKYLLFGHTPANGYYTMAYLPVRLAGGNTVHGGRFHNPAPYATEPTVVPRRFKPSPQSAALQIQRQFEDRLENFRAMARINLDDRGLEQYLDMVLDDWSKKDSSAKSAAGKSDFNRRECTRLFTEGSGNQLPGAAHTLWAAVSAVTEYVDFFNLGPEGPSYLAELWFSELKGSAIHVAGQIAGRN